MMPMLKGEVMILNIKLFIGLVNHILKYLNIKVVGYIFRLV